MVKCLEATSGGGEILKGARGPAKQAGKRIMVERAVLISF